MASTLHTRPWGQSREFLQGVNGLQVLVTQSLLAGQSLCAAQATHLPELLSHALPTRDVAQSAFDWQDGTGVMQA
jgi:hypothetical protein